MNWTEHKKWYFTPPLASRCKWVLGLITKSIFCFILQETYSELTEMHFFFFSKYEKILRIFWNKRFKEYTKIFFEVFKGYPIKTLQNILKQYWKCVKYFSFFNFYVLPNYYYNIEKKFIRVGRIVIILEKFVWLPYQTFLHKR